jgi:RecB family exonuclease
MIRLAPGTTGIGPLARELDRAPSAPGRANRSRPTMVLVPSSAARDAADAIVATHHRPHPAQNAPLPRVVGPAEFARLILTAANQPVRDLVVGPDRHRLLAGYLDLCDSAGRSEHEFEIGRAFDDARLASAGPDEIRVHADAAGLDAWLVIADRLQGWSEYLRAHQVTDYVGLLTDAMFASRNANVVQRFWETYPNLIVSDVDRLDPPLIRILTSLLGPGMNNGAFASMWGRTVPVKAFGATQSVNNVSTHTVTTELIRCHHPSMEAEAVAGVLAAANRSGIPWSDMVVVVPSSRERLRSIARAARRANIPVSGAPAPRLEGPIISALMVEIETREDDAPTLTPATLMQSVVPAYAEALTSGNTVGEMILALVVDAQQHDHLSLHDWAAHLATNPVAALPPQPAPHETVALCTIDELLDRSEAPLFTVLIGCVEGELPSRRPSRTYDPAVLDGPHALAEADHVHVEHERLRFTAVQRATAAQGTVLCVAAPQPGVLVSRFTEGLTAERPQLPPRTLDAERWPIGLLPTTNSRQLLQHDTLSLSASQINMFDNCPWHYIVQYRLGIRTEGGLAARFGTYIHDVLETFVNHDHEHGVSLDGLLQLADDKWDPDITDYGPQEDDYRRRSHDMLSNWWVRDGQDLISTGRAAHTEYEFAVPIGAHTIKGFIDRIDLTPAGLAIIDYKTSATPKSQAETNEDLQLAVYHYAASTDPALTQLGPVRSLQLDFVANDKQVRQEITPNHLQETEARILAVAERMLTEETQPSVMAECNFCDLHRLCDLQAAGRPVPVRMSRP